MTLPQATIAPSAAKRVANFDVWVFRDEILRVSGEAANGACVEVIDAHGTFLAYAFHSTVSHIALRVISRDKTRQPDAKLLQTLIERSINRRGSIRGTDAMRLVSSEADELPGLIVDQYGSALVMQIRSAGMEPWREVILQTLGRQLRPTGILERSDKEFRADEGLPELTAVHAGSIPERLSIVENGIRFAVDPYKGHKTGFYLDQRDTRRWVYERISPGQRLLDVFAYTGSFGIGAAARGAEVVLIERQEDLKGLADEQAAANGVADRTRFVAADAFYWLESKSESRERFEWILLDPPGLAKSKSEVPKARRALHHLLVHALPLLAPGGTLLVSICTYHLLGVLEEILRIAASECRVRACIRAVSMQAEDHPWILQVPATRYLVTWALQRAE